MTQCSRREGQKGVFIFVVSPRLYILPLDSSTYFFLPLSLLLCLCPRSTTHLHPIHIHPTHTYTQAYLQQRLGQYLTIATINANLLRNLMTAWLVYDEQQQRYVNFDEAAALVEAYRQRQANQQQPQQQEEQLLDQQQSSSNGSSSSSESVAAAGENRQGKPAVITASIPLDKLLGVRAAAAAGANGSSTSSSSSSGGGAQQLATSSSSRSSSGGDRGPSGSAAATGV